MFRKYLNTVKHSNYQNKVAQDINKNFSNICGKINNCELCNSDDLIFLFNNDKNGINQKTSYCNKCGFMFLNPRIKNDYLTSFYESEQYRALVEGVNSKNHEQELYESVISELKIQKPHVFKKPDFNKYYRELYLDFIYSEIHNFETVLDVGCGRGEKLKDFNFLGKKVEGIDPSNSFIRGHIKSGLNSKAGQLKDVKKNYDLVILSHVFEHLDNLTESVNILAKITNKYLFIEVPGNIKRLQPIQIDHNYYFSFNTLNHFILNNQFELIRMNSVSDNDYILAIYKKINKKNTFYFDKKEEKKKLKKILIKYYLKSLIIKILKLFKLDYLLMPIFYKFKNYF